MIDKSLQILCNYYIIMNNPLDKIKKYTKDIAYNVKNVFSLNLDKIIEDEYEKAFESLRKFGIIEYIKSKYKINYKKPKLEILEDVTSFVGSYSEFENKITFSKKSIESEINWQLKSLGYKEIKKSYDLIDLIFLSPLYIIDINIKKAIAKFTIRSRMFHEIWHSIDFSILHKLEEDSTIKDIDSFTILDNLELRASAFEVIMYYLVNGLYKHKKGYMTAYRNIPICRKFIDKLEKMNIYEKMNTYIDVHYHYHLGYCYGNVVVAAYKSSLKDNIYKIIDDIVHLNEERAIDVIKRYVYNPDKLLND